MYKLELEGTVGIREFDNIDSLLNSVKRIVENNENEDLKFKLRKEIKKEQLKIHQKYIKLGPLILEVLEKQNYNLSELFNIICFDMGYDFKITGIQRELYRLKDKKLVKKINKEWGLI